jgi:hypothetical protein
MKTRPILFSGPMVRALLDGSKTQTRRVYKAKNGGIWPNKNDIPGMRQILRNCPYGQPGDRLWVRETWQGPLLAEFETDADADWHMPSHIHQYQDHKHCAYAADGGPAPEFVDAEDNLQQRWRPSIHMPRWASRITLEVTGVRVERLQGISEVDAMAEGVVECPIPADDEGPRRIGYMVGPDDGKSGLTVTAREAYRGLWESINGPESWEASPWVWVVEFKRVEGGAA